MPNRVFVSIFSYQSNKNTITYIDQKVFSFIFFSKEFCVEFVCLSHNFTSVLFFYFFLFLLWAVERESYVVYPPKTE